MSVGNRVRAGIYCRISHDSEREGLGVARQEEDCRKLADRENLIIAGVYVDNDISASTKSAKVREEYDRLLSDARAGRLDVIVAYSNSRLTRRPAEWIELINLANTDKIRIKTVASGEHDLSTADGRAVALTIAAWDAAEAERTAERVTRAHAQRALAGMSHGGPRPFGWDRTDNHALRINPSEAAVIRESAQRLLAGENMWSIVVDLKKRGITSSKGNPFSTVTLRNVLLRWSNCGVRTRNGIETAEAQWPPIIDRATHERVVALLTDPNRRTNNRGTAAKYLLTSIAHCSECDGYLVGVNARTGTEKNGKIRTITSRYCCRNVGCVKVSRRMDWIDDHVTRVVLGLLEKDGVRFLARDENAARAAADRIASLEAKLALVADDYADDKITNEQFRRINDRIRPELETAKSDLRQAQPTIDIAQYTGPGVRKVWEESDIDVRKNIIRALNMRIVVSPTGTGNGRTYDPNKTIITWDEPTPSNYRLAAQRRIARRSTTKH